MVARRVLIVVFDGVTLLDVVGPADVFAEAGRYGADYVVDIVSREGEDVRASNGMRLMVDGSLDTAGSADLLLVAGGDVLVQRTDPDLVEGIGRLAADAGRVASICTGAFLLAATGLLDGHQATTHWRHAAEFAVRHPGVDVSSDSIFIIDGRFATSAGVSAGIDLALALVETDHGPDVARAVARSLVLFMQRPGGQSQFSQLLEAGAPRTSTVRRAMDAVLADPTGVHNLESLSRAVNVSPRHLNRLFRTELGKSAIAAVRDIRVDVAKAFLDSGLSVTASAERAGFGTAENLRRAFSATLRITPVEYRRRFRSALHVSNP